MSEASVLSPEKVVAVAQEVIKREAAAITTLVNQFDQSFVNVVETLLACEGHVLVAGAGTSHAVAYRLAHLLSCCGTPALFIHPGDAQHGGGGAITSRDVLFLISKGGETLEINHLAKMARQRGAKVIALTENLNSTLAQLSDLVVKVCAPPEVDPYGMIATGSSLINAAWGDALCVVLLQLRGYSKEEFGRTHPGGAVGKKLSEQGIL
jgi:D-arabinose 5-phosphate isomerase GutQ